MKKIQDIASLFFILAVTILSVVSIFGIWEVFGQDVITKSFETLGFLALITIIVLVASRFIENHQGASSDLVVPNPLFKSIRVVSLTVLIVCASVLAILGVMAIWDVIQDKTTLHKILGSVGILAFGTFIVVMTALTREGNPSFQREKKPVNIGVIVLIIFLAYIMLTLLGRLFW